MLRRLVTFMFVFLFIIGGVVGCVPAKEKETAQQALRLEIVDINTEVAEKEIKITSTIKVFNPNDKEVVIANLVYKLTPHPPHMSYFDVVYDPTVRTVPSQGSIQFTEATAIAKTGLGALLWPVLTNPQTRWAIGGWIVTASGVTEEPFNLLKK